MAVPDTTPSATATAGEDAAMQQQLQANAAGGAGGSAFRLGAGAYNGQTVYMGTTPGGPGGRGQARLAEGGGAVQQWVTPEQAYQQYFTWTPQQRMDLTSAGILSGQLNDKAGDSETATWWKSLVEQSARYGAAGNAVTPMDLAAGYLSGSGATLTDQQRFELHKGGFPSGAIFDSSGKYTFTHRDGQFIINDMTGERQYVGPKTRTTENTRVDLTDPQTAKAITKSIFQQLIGRDPVAGEYGQFADALRAAEEANPTVEHTTETYDDQGNVIATNTQAVGALRGAMTHEAQQQTLEDMLKATKEYGTQQAATTYAEATKRAIWGGPTG